MFTVMRSPQPYARLAGALYLYIIAAGVFAEMFVRERLVKGGDADATAANIAANDMLFRIGFSAELLHLAFDVIVAVLLYALLRPVHRYVALVAAFMRFACAVVLAVSSISHFVALRLVQGGEFLAGFSTEQLNALLLLALKLHGDGYAISLVFFAFACIALGWLIYRSGFLPAWLGVLSMIAGASYFAMSFSHFLSPALYAILTPYIFLPVFIAEFLLAMWLLVRGVDIHLWRKAVTLSEGQAPTGRTSASP